MARAIVTHVNQRHAASDAVPGVTSVLHEVVRQESLRVLDEYRAQMSREKACQRVNDDSMIAARDVFDRLRRKVESGEFWGLLPLPVVELLARRFTEQLDLFDWDGAVHLYRAYGFDAPHSGIAEPGAEVLRNAAVAAFDRANQPREAVSSCAIYDGIMVMLTRKRNVRLGVLVNRFRGQSSVGTSERAQVWSKDKAGAAEILFADVFMEKN